MSSCLRLWRCGNKKIGFALIELIVVLAIIAISLPVVFNLYLIDIQNQKNVYILQEVKDNGDNVLSTIENVIRQNAKAIVTSDLNTELCADITPPTTPTTSMYFLDENNNYFSFNLITDDPTSYKIASTSASGSNLLTSNRVHISNVSFSCSRTSPYSPPIVSISFTVSEIAVTKRFEEKSTLNYATNIKLLNYDRSP